MIKDLGFHSIKKIFPFLILTIVIGLGINLIFFRIEYNQMSDNMNQIDESISGLKWNYIESILQEDYLAAGNQSKAIALQIDRDLISKYPDMDRLRYQLDFPDKVDDPAYVQIFRDNLRDKYLFNIQNDNNDPFVASRNGILMDLSMNCLPSDVPRVWNTEISMHYNKALAQVAINKILSKNHGIIYWEFSGMEDPNHKILTNGDMNCLRSVYDREGFEGLRNYEFLAPAYITDAGDIFGVDDVSKYGTKTINHKIIVVQGFNLYDQIMARHAAQINNFDQQRELIRRELKHTMVLRTFTVVASTIIVLAVVYLLMVFNNRMFHDKGFCPCDKKKEGDSVQ